MPHDTQIKNMCVTYFYFSPNISVPIICQPALLNACKQIDSMPTKKDVSRWNWSNSNSILAKRNQCNWTKSKWKKKVCSNDVFILNLQFNLNFFSYYSQTDKSWFSCPFACRRGGRRFGWLELTNMDPNRRARQILWNWKRAKIKEEKNGH